MGHVSLLSVRGFNNLPQPCTEAVICKQRLIPAVTEIGHQQLEV